MRLEEAFDGWIQGRLTQAEAALLLRQRERNFRRDIERYVTDGLDALLYKPVEPDLQAPRQWTGS